MVSYFEGSNDQIISSKRGDIESLAKRLITKEKHAPSRILYCGPNFSGSGIALYRVIELKYKQPYLEKIIFNHQEKTIDTHLIKLTVPVFHKYQDPHREAFKKDYQWDFLNGSINHYRSLESGSGYLKSQTIIDKRDRGAVYWISDFYTYWKIRNYYRK